MDTNSPQLNALMRLVLPFSALILATACAPVPPRDAPAEAAGPDTMSTPLVIEDERPEPVRPKIELTEDILYKLLVAEFAGQEGQLGLAVGNYLELARSTRDPKVVERATRIAVYARDVVAATEAAQLWVELDPHNPDPHQVLAVMSLRDGDSERAMEHLQNILDHSRGDLDQKLLMIASLLSREQDKELVLSLMERLVGTRGDDPEALYALAHVTARLGELDRSEELLRKTLDLDPDNDNAGLSYITILQRQERTNDALTWLEGALSRRKDNDFNLRIAYARLLTDVKRFDEARRQFEILAEAAPNNTDVLYALGLLNLQGNRLEAAESNFQGLAETEEHGDDARYYLGRIAEEHKNYDRASVWYEGVQQGENYFDAQVRIGLLMAKQGRIEDARAHLKSVRSQGEKERAILTQAEGELLTEQDRYGEAMAVFDEALSRGYNADLLYARAMLAEKMDRLDILESDLREILTEEPEHAQALNALGYTLADRTDRYQEAYELIKRALELNPGDFYILDSMGWVLYRLGRLDEAADYLRRAIALRPDPEIAAHLGEVLWVRGDRDAARQIWDTALKATPDDAILRDVIKRFNP
ncbi:MAG: tetratricopeptide repeat protein [Gammaproteobacteria bacterium]|nr:tetratricopeptide repeat protein [Gammaproteobacteria bacterium]